MVLEVSEQDPPPGNMASLAIAQGRQWRGPFLI